MRRLAIFASFLVLAACGAPGGDWTPIESASPARLYEDGDAALMVLPLADLDTLTGNPVSELHPDFAFEQREYAMEAVGMSDTVATIEDGAYEAGLTETASGARAYAAAIREGEDGLAFVLLTDRSGEATPEELDGRLRRLALPQGSTAASLDGAGGAVAAAPEAQERAQEPRRAASTADAPRGGLSGDLILEEYQPMGSTRVVRLDLATGRHVVEATGIEASAVAGQVAFLEGCGDYGTGRQVTIADEDGFTRQLGPCLASSFGSVGRVQLSPLGDKVALTDAKIPLRTSPEDAFPLYRDVTGVRILDAAGEMLVTDIGVASPAWGPDGTLYAVGTGEGEAAEAHGIYRFAPDLQSVERIDDGRLNAAVSSLQVRPDGKEAAFVYNGQLWTLELASGRPQRRLMWDFPLGSLAYSPDGRFIAFLTIDPLDEGVSRPGAGYEVHVFDGQGERTVRVPFIPGGPISWVP